MSAGTRRRRDPLAVGPARGLLLVLPALVVAAVFVLGGLGQALAQSLGHQPFLGDDGWSLDAWREALGDPAVRAGLGLTLRVGLVSTVLAATLGLATALVVRRAGRALPGLRLVLQGVLATPHLVGALGIALLLSPSGVLSRLAAALGLVDSSRGFPALTQDAFGWGIIAEYAWKETPFLALVALASLSRLDGLEQVARTLGAGPWQRLRHVTVPLVATPLAAGALLVLAFAMGSYEVPVLLGRPYPAALPVVALDAYRDVDLSSRPEAMVVALLVAALTLAVAGLYALLVRTTARRPA